MGSSISFKQGQMPPNLMELKIRDWNDVVSDETKCMRLSHAEEIDFLSSKNANLAAYLHRHPEMAHEMMVPSGFKDCLVRRYERYLSGTDRLCVQNGTLDEARFKAEAFDALLPGTPKVHKNPKNATVPTWREVNRYVCRNAKDQLTGEAMAPHFEYMNTGQRVRILKYEKTGIEIEINAKQWLYIWNHHVCCFLDSPDPKHAEFVALHKAYDELCNLPEIYHEWKFPIGQQIAILLKQLEHRLRAAHIGRPNPCNECCPFRKPTKKLYAEFLSKNEAAPLVCEERIDKKRSTHAVTYDQVVRAELEKRGVSLPADFAECCASHQTGDHHTSSTENSDDQDWEEFPADFQDRIKSALYGSTGIGFVA